MDKDTEKIIIDALKQTSSLTEPLLREEFLKIVKIPSENVRKCIHIEFTILSTADLNKRKREIVELFAAFITEDCVEYLITFKKWYEFKYHFAPETLRMARLQELSALSMREPIFYTMPTQYIEFIVLAGTLPIGAAMANFPPLEESIRQLVEEHGVRPAEDMIKQFLKEKQKSKELPKGQRTLL